MAKPVKTNAMRILETSNVEYELYQYPCSQPLDGVTVAAKIGKPVETVFKTLVTKGKSGDYFVFVVPAAEGLDLKAASRAVNEKSVEMIHVADINKVTGYVRGGCSPVGMKKLYKTVIDESALSQEKIIVSAGKIGFQVEVSPKDLASVINADFTEICKK